MACSARELLLDGALPGTVKVQDSLWTLESAETVVVTLDKTVPTWWACVIQVTTLWYHRQHTADISFSIWWHDFRVAWLTGMGLRLYDSQGDPEIDTTQVDSTMKVEEYDPETQGAIRKIMVSRECHDRRMGRQHSILEKKYYSCGAQYIRLLDRKSVV